MVLTLLEYVIPRGPFGQNIHYHETLLCSSHDVFKRNMKNVKTRLTPMNWEFQ